MSHGPEGGSHPGHTPEKKHGGGGMSRREFLKMDTTYLIATMAAAIFGHKGLKDMLEKGAKGISMVVDFISAPVKEGGGGGGGGGGKAHH